MKYRKFRFALFDRFHARPACFDTNRGYLTSGIHLGISLSAVNNSGRNADDYKNVEIFRALSAKSAEIRLNFVLLFDFLAQ